MKNTLNIYKTQDDEDEEFHILPKHLQIELISFEEPPDCNKEKYKPIVLLALGDELRGVPISICETKLEKYFTISPYRWMAILRRCILVSAALFSLFPTEEIMRTNESAFWRTTDPMI